MDTETKVPIVTRAARSVRRTLSDFLQDDPLSPSDSGIPPAQSSVSGASPAIPTVSGGLAETPHAPDASGSSVEDDTPFIMD